MPEYNQKEKLEERDIVLEIVKDVSHKFLVEFRGGEHKRIVHHGNWSEEIIEPDSRKEAIQGVELLTALLRPHFKNKKYCELKMVEKHKTLIKSTKELLDKYEKNEEDKIDLDTFIRDKLVLMRDWFGELIILLHKTKYLKRKVGL